MCRVQKLFIVPSTVPGFTYLGLKKQRHLDTRTPKALSTTLISCNIRYIRCFIVELLNGFNKFTLKGKASRHRLFWSAELYLGSRVAKYCTIATSSIASNINIPKAIISFYQRPKGDTVSAFVIITR